MISESSIPLDDSHLADTGASIKREISHGDSVHGIDSKKRHKEVVEESEGEHSVFEEELEVMRPHREHPKVKERIQKAKIVVSKQYGNIQNKELVDMLYDLSRAYFKSGDTNRYAIFDYNCKS